MSSLSGEPFAAGDDDAAGDGPVDAWAAFGMFHTAVQALAELGRDELMVDPRLGELVVGLVAGQQVLAAVTANVVGALEATGKHRDTGLFSMRSWLAWQCRLSRTDAGRAHQLAIVLRDRPALDAALCAGEVTLSHAYVLATLARDPRFREAYADEVTGEPVLLDHARSLEFADFKLAVEYWKQHADPDGTEAAARDDHEARKVELHDGLRGTGILSGELTATCREAVAGELGRLEGEMFRSDWAAAKEALGREPNLLELERTAAQRRHDALELMAERSARPDDVVGKRPEPLLTVHLGQKSFERLCELASGRVVTPGQVVPYLDRAWVERILWDAKGRVVDVGQARSFTGATRRAVQVKYRRCAWPGCPIPVGRCEVDHVHPHSHGGTTEQLNGQPLCAGHNRLKATLPAEQLPEFDPPGRSRFTGREPRSHEPEPGPDPPNTS